MGKSKKRTPVCTWCCCKSQKVGKQISHRKFRRREQMLIYTEEFGKLPFRQWEIVKQWDLGGDGKHYFGHSPGEDWYLKLMRKFRSGSAERLLDIIRQLRSPVYPIFP